MTDQTDSPADETTPRPADELAMLKERAKMMGINVGNASLETLRKKVNAAASGEKPAKEEFEPNDTTGEAVAERPLTKAEIEQKLREDLYREQMALVRCRIYNLNPGKRDLQGEIITVGNRYVGTVRKFIPFGEATDGGYHIPRIIYEDLMSRKFQQIRTKKNPQHNAQIDVDTRLIPEYSIEVLPPLSEEELKELALKQSAAERMGA